MSNKSMFRDYLNLTVCSFLYASSVNLFIVPFSIYNGGLVGTSQIIRTLLETYLHLSFNFDIAGIINLLINLPMLVAGFLCFKRSFVHKTLVSVLVQTLAFSLVPITPLIHDKLASLVIGGIFSGVTIAGVLIQRGSAGGTTILGMLIAKRFPKLSVGRFSLGYDCFVFVMCGLLFSVETAIYSLIYSVVYAIALDRYHLQNIGVSMMIFTKNKEVSKYIVQTRRRGVNRWAGEGVYSGEETDVLLTVVSKNEVSELKREIREIDPKAFIVVSKTLDIDGNFERRLTD